MDTPKRSNKAVVAIVVIALLAAATTGVIFLGGKKATPVASATSDQSPSSVTKSSPQPTSSVSSDATYKDGSYKTMTSYMTPGGPESITVTVTIAGGVISATDMQGNPTTRDAQEYQDIFLSEYKSSVVGKKLSDISLDRIAGASLTSNGFNDALDTIRIDAKA